MTTIRKIMEALGINQVETARITGKSQAAVSKWVHGHHDMTVSDLQKLHAEFVRRGIEWRDEFWTIKPDEAA